MVCVTTEPSARRSSFWLCLAALALWQLPRLLKRLGARGRSTGTTTLFALEPQTTVAELRWTCDNWHESPDLTYSSLPSTGDLVTLPLPGAGSAAN